MSLKAVLLDFNGTIIDDEAIHKRLIQQLCREAGLVWKPIDYFEVCLGRNDQNCLLDLFARQENVLSPEQLDELVQHKARLYQTVLAQQENLPIYPDVADFLFKLRSFQLNLAIVSGARRAEIEFVLQQANLTPYFSVIIPGDEVDQGKPAPEGYLRAIEQLRNQFPDLDLQAYNCLAIEDSYAGIEAAKQAKIKVAAVANTCPFHMLQRLANWTVDHLRDLEIDRIQAVFSEFS